MQNDLKKFEQSVNNAVTVSLTQNQFDALVSLTYKIGSGAFEKSTLVKKLNTGDYLGVANQFDVWVNAGGKRLQGLVNRRAKAEARIKEKEWSAQLLEAGKNHNAKM